MTDAATQDRVKAPSKTRVWILAVAGVGVAITIAGIFISQANSAKAPSDDSSRKMSELGTQWAQGYLEAISDRPRANALTSLYGACILQMNSAVAAQYGDQAAQSWLAGCLTLTRQTNQIPAQPDPSPSLSTGASS